MSTVSTIGVVAWWLAQMATANAPTPMKAPLPSEIWPEAPVRNDRPSNTIDIEAPVARLKLVVAGRKNVIQSVAAISAQQSDARQATGCDARSPGAAMAPAPTKAIVIMMTLSIAACALGAAITAMTSATTTTAAAIITRWRGIATSIRLSSRHCA